MRKVGLAIIGGIAAIVLLTHVGPLIGLLISLVLLYFSFKKFMAADSTFKKIVWAIIGVIALTASASNVPAILAIAAAVILYMVYKKWNEQKSEKQDTSDPFQNFEKEWGKLQK
ncbi:lmo0954 family membrane protein [Falsibacillus albus]|uniref:Flagellar basal body rod protein n=1 Tax=Falsibacillus albus TaxID=2478915 RepID=A0A3L7JRG6_9BACI|nr:flagellar basal body rod protein [Falsibacillus albus]RLQ93080.1 flagellar basal body rod protein [Falsibacillus albus]